jgi:hypothetical protein
LFQFETYLFRFVNKINEGASLIFLELIGYELDGKIIMISSLETVPEKFKKMSQGNLSNCQRQVSSARRLGELSNRIEIANSKWGNDFCLDGTLNQRK